MTIGSLVSWLVVAIALGFAIYKVIAWNLARRRAPARKQENLKLLGRASFAVGVACFAAATPLEGESIEMMLLFASLALVGVDVWLSSKVRR